MVDTQVQITGLQKKAPARPSRARTLAIVLLAVAAGTAGDLLLSHGMQGLGDMAALSMSRLGTVAHAAVTSPPIVVGIACMALYFGLYLVALSWAELSFVLPITALGFVLVALFAQFVLHEPVSPVRWLGVVCIVVGVGYISRS